MKNLEVIEAERQQTPAEQRAQLAKLINNSPSRMRGRFTPDFTLTPEYEELKGVDTSTMSDKQIEEHNTKLFMLKKYGTYTDVVRQREIDNSLAIPLSESIKLRDQYLAQIEKLEHDMDNFDVSSVNAKAEALEQRYRKMLQGKNGIERASIQAEYNKEYDKLKLEEYTKPYNDLAVARFEAIERYKVHTNRIRLYIFVNKDAIQRQLDKARDAEINENLLALAEYMEG